MQVHAHKWTCSKHTAAHMWRCMHEETTHTRVCTDACCNCMQPKAGRCVKRCTSCRSMRGCTHVQTHACQGVCLQAHAPRCTCCNCMRLNTGKCKCMQRDKHAANTGMPACTQRHMHAGACSCKCMLTNACAADSCVGMSVPTSACTCKYMLMRACMSACAWILIYTDVCTCKHMQAHEHYANEHMAARM